MAKAPPEGIWRYGDTFGTIRQLHQMHAPHVTSNVVRVEAADIKQLSSHKGNHQRVAVVGGEPVLVHVTHIGLADGSNTTMLAASVGSHPCGREISIEVNHEHYRVYHRATAVTQAYQGNRFEVICKLHPVGAYTIRLNWI